MAVSRNRFGRTRDRDGGWGRKWVGAGAGEKMSWSHY